MQKTRIPRTTAHTAPLIHLLVKIHERHTQIKGEDRSTALARYFDFFQSFICVIQGIVFLVFVVRQGQIRWSKFICFYALTSEIDYLCQLKGN